MTDGFYRADERRVMVSALHQKMHDELEWKESKISLRKILVVHSGANMGFTHIDLLIWYKNWTINQWDMNEESYGRRTELKLTPNLLTDFVVVIDNAPY